MTRKQRKYFGKKKKRPVGYFRRPKKQQYKSHKRRHRKSSAAAATAVGVASAGVAVVGTLALFNKTDFLAQDALSKKIGLSAATPAGAAFFGAGWAAGNRHPVAKMAFQGVGLGLIVTDLARVLLGKFGVILAPPAPGVNVIQPNASPAPQQPVTTAGALPTGQQVQERRERDAAARVASESPEILGARQSFGMQPTSNNRVAALLSLKRRAA